MHTIYTLGYQGSTPATVKHYVDTLGARLVDIRFAPYSRDPRWQQQALYDLVQPRYLYIKALGNVNYKNGGPIQLADPLAALASLAPLLEERPIILLCGCWNVDTCHRKVAADYLAEQLGAPIEHLPGRLQRSLVENTIKCISLTQPWASLVAIGAKSFETRSWQTPYRGELAIHAAKGFPGLARNLCGDAPFGTVLADAYGPNWWTLLDRLRGKVLCTCRLVNCIRTEEIAGQLSEQELAFGDYAWGRWAWVLGDVQVLSEPVPARGALGLWDWAPPVGETLP